MIPLYTQEQFNNSKSKDLLKLQCKYCKTSFFKTKKRVKDALNPNLKEIYDFCSKQCQNDFKKTSLVINCTNCNTFFNKQLKRVKKSKTNNHFCSKSCAASYNNKHKSKGTRRSKLEIWLEQQLTQLYPNLHIDYNKTSAINSELDIYIPSLNIAFELNGIFHYEPIYGVNKLQKIQDNDQNKFKLCQEHKIDLCIIDTSGQKYFKESTSKKYLDIILNLITKRYPIIP